MANAIIDPTVVADLLKRLPTMDDREKLEVLGIIEELEKRQHAEKCRDDLIEFCKHIDPEYLVAAHHRKLANLLMDIADGKKDRIAVSVPPRHGKSHLISTLFPAWYLGKFPNKKVLMVSNTTDLAVDFGRKVRNIIADPRYSAIFPTISLSQDSKSAGRWSTNHNGEYFATGVGSALAGRGADLLLIDDPHDEQDLLAGNFDALEKAYQWFTFGARTRLMSQGKIAIVHCMVGDTRVLLADNTNKYLRDIRPGDEVATYRDGGVHTARVLNWANQGPDHCFTIKMSSGTIVQANGKHPFLVNQNGVSEWTQAKNLRVGQSLMGVSQWNAESSHPTKVKKYPNGSTQKAIGVSGEGSVAPSMAATSPQTAKACANPTTIKNSGLLVRTKEVLTKVKMLISGIGTGLTLMSTIGCLRNKMGYVRYAKNHQGIMYPLSGGEGSQLTTAMTPTKSEGFFATIATSPLVTEKQKESSLKPLSTYEIVLDQIVEITLDTYEDVFDIQVEGTENFIANGLVSHNTRWHQDDLIGRLVRDSTNNVEADQYEIFEFPAILPSGRALWPEKFDLTALGRTKASMAAYQWNAQYMQAPSAEEAALVKREWWMPWKEEDPPRCDYVIMALDAAAESHNRADFTAITTWGVFSDDKLTDGASHLILLNAVNVRVEFPELKELALREYKEWEPDAFIVEKKSAGTQLYQELRRIGVPVQEFTPGRNTGDKIARMNAISDIIRSGMVWYPEGRRWAEQVIEQCVSFPYGSNDDLVDTTSMALARFRQGGFISLPSDFKDREYLSRRTTYY